MNIKQFFRSMLSDNTGEISSQRFIVLLTGLSILVVYISQNITAMVAGKAHVDFMANEVLLMGTVLAFKVVNSISENMTKKVGQ